VAIPSEIAKEMTLDLSDIPESQREQAKRDAGEFVVGEILRFVSSGNSPVANRGKFKRLDGDYADKAKGGNRTPDLELKGDMLDALEARVTNDGIEVGIFESSQVPKADGHNNFSGESSLPTRRFIPTKKEDFKRSIKEGVDDILEGYRSSFQEANRDNQEGLNFLVTGALNMRNARRAIEQQELTINDVIGDFLGEI